MPLAQGDTFAGYTIVRLLGSGGMGEVYLAEHPRLPRREALKILPTAWTSDREYRERFNREAELAATLYHPHIVGVHDRGEADGQLWIAMDYVDGADTAELLRSRYPAGMPRREALDIITAIAQALDYAHLRALLHRDVKPANILLSEPDSGANRTLLADFGIARRLDDISGLTATNMTVGTVIYAAPEQLMDAPIDGRADQYSLAATAYHLLTGAPPFPHSNPAVVISRHLNAPPPTLAETIPELGDLDEAVSRALAKDPNDRYDTCERFAQALTHTVDTAFARRPATSNAVTRAAAAAAHPDNATTPVHRPAIRAGTVIPIALALLLIAAITFVGIQIARNQQQANPPQATVPITATTPSLPPPAPPPIATTTTTRPQVNCGVNLRSSSVVRAVALVEPTAMYPLDPDHAWGNFDPCAQLSVALIPTAMGTGSSPVEALMFHEGEYVGTATPDGVGYLAFNENETTDDTVVLTFRTSIGTCGGCDDGTYEDVRFQWRNGEVVALDPIPDLFRYR
jgi:serine/threonine-protein kinase